MILEEDLFGNVLNEVNCIAEKIIFSIICKFMIKKGIGGKFIRNVLDFHKDDKLFTVPDNIPPKEKTKTVVEFCIKNYMNHYHTITYQSFSCADKLIGFANFFSSLHSAFPWGMVIEGDVFWRDIHNEWVKYLGEEITKLINKGIVEDDSFPF